MVEWSLIKLRRENSLHSTENTANPPREVDFDLRCKGHQGLEVIFGAKSG